MEPKSATEVQPKRTEVHRGPAFSLETSGKAVVTRFGIKLFPFPVNPGPTRAYDSAMGGNASTGHHSLGDMKSMGADDRPIHRDEDTNRKSLFPATKTFHTHTLKPFSGSLWVFARIPWITTVKRAKLAHPSGLAYILHLESYPTFCLFVCHTRVKTCVIQSYTGGRHRLP